MHPNDGAIQRAWMKRHQKRLLDKGNVEKLACVLRGIESRSPEATEKLRSEADYFERNAERMRSQST
jgi:hypothetical protein